MESPGWRSVLNHCCGDGEDGSGVEVGVQCVKGLGEWDALICATFEQEVGVTDQANEGSGDEHQRR